MRRHAILYTVVIHRYRRREITENPSQDHHALLPVNKVESYLKYGFLGQHLCWITAAGSLGRPHRSTNHRPMETFRWNVSMGLRFDKR